MSRVLFSTALALTLLAAACAPRTVEDPATDTADATIALGSEADTAAAVVTKELLREPIAELSSDAYGGRGPGGPGDEMTQEYLVEQMEALGLEPGGPNGSWLQPFEMVSIDSSAPETWTFEKAGTTVGLSWWDDFIAGSGVQTPTAEIEKAELVFVGYGIEAPEFEWNDFKDVDVSGKVLVVMNNDPDWDPALFEGVTRLYYGRWDYKYEQAAAKGAVGAIIIHTTPSAGYPFKVVQTSWTGPQFEIPAGDEPRLEIAAWTTEDAMRTLFDLAGEDLDAAREAAKSRDFQPIPLGITTSLRLENVLEEVETANVLGVLPGSDPEFADEYVIYTAHHDHLGIGKPNDAGDEIYNGARDNAAGVSQVLAIAHTFKALEQAPRRSILFAFVAAEEQGLLGSEYFALNPTVPPGKIAATLNYDGGNIWGKTADITYVGYGKSSLDRVIDAFAAEQGRIVKPDQFPDRGYFYRSDQFNLAKIGVPAVYTKSGTEFADRPDGWGKEQIDAWTEIHYHQPSDELVDDWSFDGMIDDVVLGFKTGYWVAQADEMPSWNPGDEFEAARLTALEGAE
jgi:Zn-dependent M28 family amino/carboxypeptidase